jgi:Zn ribbon nucleic-acid-binding protein
MQNSCLKCGQNYEITDDDLAFYDKVSPVFAGRKYIIPPPTLCHYCRAQRRLAFRNERKLYHRKCDLSGRQMLSIYSQDKPYKVYEHKEWWSDKWDALNFGRDFDFKIPFFEQFEELSLQVPQMNVISESNENCDYCNLTANGKNNYLIFESSNNEDCMYGYWLQKCNDCTDVSFSHESELCYETDNCYNCNNLKWSKNCRNCHDSAFLFDCAGCKNCFMCANLRQKEYCIMNKQYTKYEYGKEIIKYLNGSCENLKKTKIIFKNFIIKQPHRAAQIFQSENCTGDYIQESRNCIQCFHAHIAEDCKYGEHVWRNSKCNMDVSTVGRDAELVYEAINTGIGAFNDLFVIQCWSGTSNLIYCTNCFSSKNCFGCVGLKHKQYCILNKQYSKEQYEKTVGKIIDHMSLTREWGEFFPINISKFGYNETVAQEQFPLTEKESVMIGAKWKKEETINEYQGGKVAVPDKIDDVSDTIVKEILKCNICGRNYKIIAKELEFYKKQNIPVPHNCPECRHSSRMNTRSLNKIFVRTCAKCNTEIQTTYAPTRPEIVYCEKCYLEAVY